MEKRYRNKIIIIIIIALLVAFGQFLWEAYLLAFS